MIILITNQPDVAYGTMKRNDHEKIMSEVRALSFYDIFVCEHGREDGCVCKKPKPGMLLEAAKKHKIDLASSYMVGDTKNDMEAGKSAGCTTILVEQHYNTDAEADIRVKNLCEIVDLLEKSL